MVHGMIRSLAAFYVSLMSMFWVSTVSLALSWALQFYSAFVHDFAIEIIKTGFFGLLIAKNSEIMPDEGCPTSESVKNEMGSLSEDEKWLENVKKWELARIFSGLDRNRDGMVSADDIQGLLEKFGLHYCCDESTKILMNFPEHMNFDEFCRACLSLLEEAQSSESREDVKEEGELREAFCVFDKDGDGFIAPSDLQLVLLSLGFREAQDLENCEAMITRFDKNSDGRIDFDEFENMFSPFNRH
ncbi:hypothetical protein SUGI_1072340 [Cryptomeria japonica]|uniref:calmodulin-like protein 3 n=1 Tax=Cryptomeria japonica TaxID=3369 RepID=UPI002414897B|nr:calmodulin-like protein 3 [Cryptomeria japonica]GLJ50339.1 hypothetical protein SUGI_1072340 [Cryptomeria japonica]